MPPKSAWYSEFFIEHPLYNARSKVAEAYAPGMRQRKVYCSACFSANLLDLQQKEHNLQMQNPNVSITTIEELRLQCKYFNIC